DRTLDAKRWQNPFIPIAHYLFPDRNPDEPLSGNELFLSLSKLKAHDFSLEILCATEAEETNLQKRVIAEKIQLPAKTKYSLGYLSSGFVLHEIKAVVLPITEITQRYKIRRQKQRSTYHYAPSEVFDLTPGEAVVHLNNGIGRYLGMEKKP